MKNVMFWLYDVSSCASEHIYKGKLKNNVDVTQGHLTQLADTIVFKTEENEQLREKLKTLEDKLEVTTFQVSPVYWCLSYSIKSTVESRLSGHILVS